MNLADITTKSYILTMLIRDDGERFLLGDGAFEFKDSQQHFQPNTYANDVVELQGTDGQMLAGQVRRTATQTWNGYIGDATTSKQQVEQYRRNFFLFFRPRHYYTAVYIFCDGSAIQRKRGYIVNAPSVPELWQKFPEWSVGLNFEDPNYYEYAEDDEGNEIYAHAIAIALASNISGGLVWDAIGAITNDLTWRNIQTLSGTYITMNNALDIPAKLSSFEMAGNTWQQTYTGKQLYNYTNLKTTGTFLTVGDDGWYTFTADRTNESSGNYYSFSTYNLTLDYSTSYAIVTEIASVSITGTANITPVDRWGQFETALFYNSPTVGTYVGTRTTKSAWGNSEGLVSNVFVSAGSKATIKFRISVIADTSVTPSTFTYEPYVGGTASPNPDFPQSVSTATGENVLSITGKNLMPLVPYKFGYYYGETIGTQINYDVTTSANVVSFTANEDGTSSVTSTASWRGMWFMSNELATGTYYFNLDGASTAGNLGASVYVFDSQHRITRRLIDATGNPITNALKMSITLTNDEKFIGLGIGVRTTAGTVEMGKFMLSVGSAATTYEPYQNKKQEINLGKNLFDKSTFTNILNGTISDGTITSITWTNGSWAGVTANFGAITLNQEFTISMDVRLTSGSTGTFNKINDGVADFTLVERPTISTSWQRYAFKKTPTAGYSISKFFVQFTAINGSFEIRNVQIEYGSQATAFAPALITKNICFYSGYVSSTSLELLCNCSEIRSNNYVLSAVTNATVSSASVYTSLDGADLHTSVGTFTGTANQRGYAVLDLSSIMPQIKTGQVLRFLIYRSGAGFSSIEKAMIEEGSSMTPYEPYGAPYELCKIGNYQDKIYKDEGKWYIHKEIKKITVDGSENWSDGSYYQMALADRANNNPVSAMSDHYAYSTSAEPAFFMTAGYLRIRDTRASLAAFKTWLASNPTTVYYALETPYDTQITSQALIDQLEASLATKLYVGVNNITTEIVEGNQKATLNLGYYTEYDEDGGGYEWEDGGSPRNIITIDGVDSAMPIWKVNGPATNPTLTNITTGQTLTWTGFVPSGQTLTIDMGEMTASLAGANVFEYVSGEWIELQSGNNLITYTAQGGATDPSTLEWNGVAG